MTEHSETMHSIKWCYINTLPFLSFTLYVTSHPGQLSLLPSAGLKMSTSQSAAVMLCGWGVKAGWLIPLLDKRVNGR